MTENADKNIFKEIKEYVNLKIRIATLTIGEKVAKTMASIASAVLILSFLLMFFLFAFFAVAFAIGSKIGNGWGFALVAGFLLLVAIVINSFKSKIEAPIINIFIKMFFNKNDDE